jgi:hypothetical protein
VRALKILVIAMGVLIVVGVITLVALLVARAGKGPAPVGGGEVFADTTLALPAGSRVVSVQTAADRLVVEIDTGGGGRQLLILDPRSGRRIGGIALQPAR